MIVSLSAAYICLFAGVRSPARGGGCRWIVENTNRDQQKVGIGLVDEILEPRVRRIGEPTKHVGIVLGQELLRLLDVLGIDEGVKEVRQVDVDVFVVVVLIRNQPGFHPAIKQAVDHEVVGGLEIPAGFLQINIMARIHEAPFSRSGSESRHLPDASLLEKGVSHLMCHRPWRFACSWR